MCTYTQTEQYLPVRGSCSDRPLPFILGLSIPRARQNKFSGAATWNSDLAERAKKITMEKSIEATKATRHGEWR